MQEVFDSKNEAFIKKEREKSRQLKKTRWWQEKLQKGKCELCYKPVSKEELTMDHLTPLARGGKSGKNNIVASCKPCNSKKSYKTLVEVRLKNL